jgi:hypothetical protein
MVRTRIALVVLAVSLIAAPVMAQTAPASQVGGRLFVGGDLQQMSASDTFEAVTGSASVGGITAGVEVHRVWRGAFLRASMSQLKADGERIFVFDDEVFPLGIPLKVTMTPIELGAGWRFAPVSSRLVPYVGAGAMWMKYSEKAEGDSGSDSVNETYSGAVVFGGVDVSVWRYVSAGAEVSWRTAKVKNPGGALEAFGEENLGGLSMRIVVSVGR